MVAYTLPDCIPYFECSDPICLNTADLCNPSTVWCDQATIVNQRFIEFQQTVQRTAVTVPMGILQRVEPFTHLVSNFSGTIIRFTEVVVDTDDMADLGVNDIGFTFNTSGLYEIVCYLIGTTDTSGSDLSVNLSFQLTPPFVVSSGGLTLGSTSTNFLAGVVDSIVTLQIRFPLLVQVGQTCSLSVTTGGDAADRINFTYALCSATWMADLP